MTYTFRHSKEDHIKILQKKVILDIDKDTINLNNIGPGKFIFGKRKDSDGSRIDSILMHEDKGWILKIGTRTGSMGYFDQREDCLSASAEDYEFYVE